MAAALLSVSLTRLLSPATEQSTLLRVPLFSPPLPRGERGREEGDGEYRVLPPAEVARQLNRWLFAIPTSDQFVTLVYGIFDTQTGQFRYVSAGHPALLLVGAGGALTTHRSTGPPVGCFEDSEFAEHELVLQPGERLFLYSDGFVEARNESGKLFGADQLRHRVLAGRSEPLQQHVTDLVTSVRAWAASHPQDDLSVLALEIESGSLPSAKSPEA